MPPMLYSLVTFEGWTCVALFLSDIFVLLMIESERIETFVIAKTYRRCLCTQLAMEFIEFEHHLASCIKTSYAVINSSPATPLVLNYCRSTKGVRLFSLKIFVLESPGESVRAYIGCLSQRIPP